MSHYFEVFKQWSVGPVAFGPVVRQCIRAGACGTGSSSTHGGYEA